MNKEEAIEVYNGLINTKIKEAFEFFAPELRESEDERIRKELMAVVDDLILPDDQKARFNTWLEKQKEPITPEEKMKHPLYVEGFEAGKQIGAQCESVFGKQKEQKSALTPEIIHPKFAVGDTVCRPMWSDHTIREIYVRCNDPVYVCVNEEGTESHISFSEQDEWERKEQKPVHTAKEMWKEMRLEVYAQASGNRHEPNYSDDSTKMFSLCDIDEIFEKIGSSTVGSQPAEWSEGDEKMVRFYENDYDNNLGNMPMCDVIENRIKFKGWLLNKLKSLRPQPKAELTLLDENIIEAAVAFVEKNDHFNCWGGIDKHTVIKALRSLKPHWKPSEEQIVALARATNRCVGVDDAKILLKLLEQLEKLYSL